MSVLIILVSIGGLLGTVMSKDESFPKSLTWQDVSALLVVALILIDVLVY